MAYNLVRLSHLTEEDRYKKAAERQLDFLLQRAAQYPTGHAIFLTALLSYNEPPTKITVVPDETADTTALALALPHGADVIQKHDDKDYPLINNKTTYYICRGHRCLPPGNDLPRE